MRGSVLKGMTLAHLLVGPLWEKKAIGRNALQMCFPTLLLHLLVERG